MKPFYSLTVAFTVLLASLIHPIAADAEEGNLRRPNMILVFIDDMGWADFSCFGNEAIRTTNIDRLASEGLRFHQFYVNSPICTPSRTAISTGQYPQRWRMSSYLADRAQNVRRGVAQWLDPAAPMLPRILQQAGYATGHFGKWHMGGQRDVGDAPLIAQYGFDESLTNFEGLGPRILPLLDSYDGTPAKKYSLGSGQLAKGPIHWEPRDKITASFANAALAFIEKTQASGRPFYINLWPDDVHSPFFPPKDRRGDSSKRELYLGVLKTMDEQLGLLFDRVRNDPSLRDNTLILVCSDNGPEDGAGSAGTFRGMKTMLYEGGIRSPLIVWGPGFVNESHAGTVNKASFFSAFDLVPSLLTIASVAIPTDVEFDGEGLPEVVLGDSQASRSGPLFFRRPPDRPSHPTEGNLPDLAVRDGKWKLLCEYDGSKPQLYNLDKDPGETRNVAGGKRKLVDRLKAAVLEWNDSMPADEGANFAAVNPR
jgi:arylsulfatase A-like enzyme